MKRFYIWLVDHASPLIALGLVVSITSVFWWHYERSQNHLNAVALDDAKAFSSSVAQFRNFYANTIIPAVALNKVPVTHNYLNIPGAVPLPATFAIDFGDTISKDSNYRVRLYSDMPFSWRVGGGLRDDFEKEAMTFLRENPDSFFSRSEVVNGSEVLRYAVADKLKASCVACHNSYEGTPKTDWKEGDVRGVLEVTRPISKLQASNELQAWQTFLAMLAIALLVLLMLGFVIRRNKMTVAQAQAEQYKTQAIMDSIPDAIVVINEHGRVLQANHTISAVLGYQPEELIGNNISMVMPEPYRSAHDGYLQRYLKEGGPRVIGFTRLLEVVKKSGEQIPIDLKVTEIMHEGVRSFTGVIRDVSDREAVKRQLELARDQALESAKLKSEFLANMSHEIRTPMNGVIGMTALLLDTSLSAEQKDLTLTVKSSAESLLGIINDILDFSKIEAGKLEVVCEPVDLIALLDSVMDMVASSAQAKGLGLAYFIDPNAPKLIETDPIRLRQVLINLLGNAIKFTLKGHVYLNVTKQDNQTIYFEVIDTGIGISAEGQAKLFGAFSQVDSSSTRGFGGTGLGLAISRQLVELLGGRISVQSEQGKGSNFNITITHKTLDTAPCLLPLIQPINLAWVMHKDQLAERYIQQFSQLNIHVSVFDLVELNETRLDPNTPVWLDLDAIISIYEHPLSLLNDIKAQYPHVTLLVSHQQANHWREAIERLEIKLRLKPVKYKSIAHWVLSFQQSSIPSVTNNNLTHAVQLADLSNAKILLVEDNIVNQKLALALLKKNGLSAAVANNGQEALDYLAQHPVDLVLMDCQMPIKDGFETTIALRASSGINKNVPIIAMTANAMEGDDIKCYEVGMNDYISKPINPSLLAEKLMRWLGNKIAQAF